MRFPVFFEPDIDIDSFKDLLIQKGYAKRIVYYTNGEIETIPWRIYRLDLDSDLLGNIYTYHKFRNWKSKGIEKVVIRCEQSQEIKSNQELSDKDLKDIIRFSVKLKTLAKEKNQTLLTALIKCLYWYSKSKETNEKNNIKQRSKMEKNVPSYPSNYSYYPDAFCKKDEFDGEIESIINRIKKTIDEDR